MKYGKKAYPLFSNMPLSKKSKGDTVYFPKCGVPFKLQKGKLPKTSQSYKIVDVTNHADKERQFELHVTYRKHVPTRKATGTWGGLDLNGENTVVAVMSDDTKDVLTLREKDTLRRIAKTQKQMSRCKLHSQKWKRLHALLYGICRKMGNRQMDKLRKFSKKLLKRCDKIIMEGMNLATMTKKGPGQKAKNRKMRQSKCGMAREHIAHDCLTHNVEYMEINPKNTSKQCCMCGSLNTDRFGGFKVWYNNNNIIHEYGGHGRKFKCKDCGGLMHADVNAAYNILYCLVQVWWSKRIQSVYKLQTKAGMVLRGQIHLATLMPPSVAGDMMAGTGCHQDRLDCRTDNGHLNGTPLNGKNSQHTRKSELYR